MYKTSIYKLWSHIKERCEDVNNIGYSAYGGNGIYMCKEWSESFINFYNDMGNTYKKDLHIDRIDTFGPYSKENCRFVERKINNANRRNYGKYLAGVVKNKENDNYFLAKITIEKKKFHIGSFKTEIEAHDAFKKVHMEWYGF